MCNARISCKPDGTCCCLDKHQSILVSSVATKKTVIIPYVWVLGLPSSGKSNVCAKMCKNYPWAHINCQTYIEAELKADTPLAQELKSALDNDEPVPPSVLVNIIKDQKSQRSNSYGFVIDGYPLNTDQAMEMYYKISNPNLIIYIDAPVDAIIQRKVAADAGDEARDRMRAHLETVNLGLSSVLSAYTAVVARVNGSKTLDEVYKEVEKLVDPIFQSTYKP